MKKIEIKDRVIYVNGESQAVFNVMPVFSISGDSIDDVKFEVESKYLKYLEQHAKEGWLNFFRQFDYAKYRALLDSDDRQHNASIDINELVNALFKLKRMRRGTIVTVPDNKASPVIVVSNNEDKYDSDVVECDFRHVAVDESFFKLILVDKNLYTLMFFNFIWSCGSEVKFPNDIIICIAEKGEPVFAELNKRVYFIEKMDDTDLHLRFDDQWIRYENWKKSFSGTLFSMSHGERVLDNYGGLGRLNDGSFCDMFKSFCLKKERFIENE